MFFLFARRFNSSPLPSLRFQFFSFPSSRLSLPFYIIFSVVTIVFHHNYRANVAIRSISSNHLRWSILRSRSEKCRWRWEWQLRSLITRKCNRKYSSLTSNIENETLKCRELQIDLSIFVWSELEIGRVIGWEVQIITFRKENNVSKYKSKFLSKKALDPTRLFTDKALNGTIGQYFLKIYPSVPCKSQPYLLRTYSLLNIQHFSLILSTKII